jgi:glycosyltransferase involved in cell wall biosynthesis
MRSAMPETKKKITWITPDYFLCVDAFIVPELSNDYEIEWFLINTLNTKRKSDGLVLNTFKPKEFNLKYRQKDPRIVLQYLRLIKEIRESDAELIYISFHGLPYFFPLFFLFINTDKVIYGAHNVSTPKGASNERLMRIYHDYVYNRIKYFHVFSKSQLSVISKLLPNKKAYYAPLALENYGASEVIPPNNIIRFLFFGYIREYKRLDLLLKAFQDLYNSGIQHIELHIAGYCENWEYYQSMITINDKIKLRNEIIPNKDLPDIIASCHYMVLPYQDIAQSAVLTLAYQYNKPVIVSDIEPFKEFVLEGTTGYFFKSQCHVSLFNVMREVVANHGANYQNIKNNISAIVKKEYSITSILSKYKLFLNECIWRNSNEIVK